MNWLEAGIQFLIQATATLAGAFTAFHLEEQRQRRHETRVKLGNLRQGLFTLAMQRSFLLNLRKQYLDAHANTDAKAFTIPPILTTPPSVLLDVAALAFLIDDEGDLLAGLVHAELGFKLVANIIELRCVAVSRK